MNPKTTGVLALFALGLGAFVFFYEIKGGLTREVAIEEAKKIHFGLEATEVTAVMLTTLDGVSARFERIEGRWEVVEPISARADATALDAIAHALVNMPREGSVEGGGPLRGFGLGDSAQAIRFEIGDETRGLRIGRSTPVGGHRYVARLGDDEVAFVASYRVNAFKRNLDDLRDRRIFQFEAGEVRTLRVRWPTGSGGEQTEVALARDDLGQWHLGVPLVGLADQKVVRDLLSNLAYLRAEAFLDDPGALARLEGSEGHAGPLEQTAFRFDWTVEGSHLERGARIAGSIDNRRVIEAPGGRLYAIGAERLDDFPRGVVDYRFKRLSSFEVSRARRLEMEFRSSAEGGGGEGASSVLRVVAELAPTGWASPGSGIDPDRVSRLIREMASLDAVDIVADAMGPNELASLGLDPPLARIRIEAAADPEARRETLAELTIGRFDPDRGVFAKRGDASTIFLLPKSVAADLPISVQRYRSDFQVATDEDGEGEASNSHEPPGADPLEGLDLP